MPEILGVRVGWAGRYKVGFWTPVEVTIRGGAHPGQAVLVLEIPDSEGTLACFGTRVRADGLLRWTSGQQTTYQMYVVFGQTESGLTVSLHEAEAEGDVFRAGAPLVRKNIGVGPEERPDQVLPALSATQLLLVGIGADSVGLEEAVRPVEITGSLQWPKDREPVVVWLSQREQMTLLPRRWYGYEGVDLLVLATSQPNLLQPLWTDTKRWEALQQWIRLGGKCVVFLGSQAELVARPESPLAVLLPGPLQGLDRLRSVAGYEMYADSTRPVPGMGRPESAVPVPRWDRVEGVVEVHEGELALVVRRAYGLGEVVILGGDFDRPPLALWPDRGRLLRKVLNLPLPKVDPNGEGGALLHTGYRDISGQLRSGLDQFDGLPMISFWPVAGLILLYILLIGPGDYFLLRKVVGRMHWTWITFSSLVVLAAVGAYALSVGWKGRQIRYNQVDVLDVDVAGGQVRGTTWVNLFSPRTDTYDLSLTPYGPDGRPLENAQAILSGIGLAGEGLGGVRTRPGSTLLWDRRYEWSAEGDQLLGFPVHVWSSRMVLARWCAACPAWPQMHLVERDQLPEGTLTNTLPVALEDCTLAYGRWGYALGRLAPGQSVRIEPMSRSRIELPTLLGGGGGGQVGTAGWALSARKPYNPQSHDLAEILRTMMFFQSLGGQSYTGLTNQYHSFIDGTPWLQLGQAVLLARITRQAEPTPSQSTLQGTADRFPLHPSESSPGVVLLRNGRPLAHSAQDEHLVWVRFVYSVFREKSAMP